ncbi:MULTISPECIES: DUF1761 domain-containing protein [Nocardiaceae]|uniref:DUF1761 domain-containing protein n=1 Tax=Nocardiaceae TaxID=85025 RepID=UPI000522E6B8|nr:MULTISPECIES: DUF1761 domain-containing protein [Rhodococcus]OZD12546.1 DUF1761 domain-containing protein [Rhodococcus sp. 06-156-4a]OZD18045.1 DUF1761 domain-containing protein [Rhodococcus sp. 06-156-3C]OZD20393.1 DUF1761 domain-containing protein [Rhodococcus sp. 06-156-4C]OZD29239.1 DUF1761 domain-containing protein [Rhodococcus sp. 06-156-3]OZD30510.1 DUF1761 domain-containing protein [Rhodococcus sp. 06-156-3b]
MFDVLTDINWLAVLAAFVASAVIAGVYFPVLIAKPYIVALGRENAGEPESSLVRNLGPVACILVTTITSAVLITALDITAVGDAVVFGLLVGIGYLTAMTFQIALNPNFPRPLYYGVLNAPFFIITSVLTSVIIVWIG